MGPCFAGILVSVLSAAPALRCQEPALQLRPSELRPLDTAAHALASVAREEEARELIEMLREFGYPTPTLARLEARCARTKPDPKKAARTVPRVAKRVAHTATTLAKKLSVLPAEQGVELAARIVRLHGDVPEAQRLLGRQKVSGVWLIEEDRRLRERRLEILAAVQKARRLEFDLQSAASEHPVLLTAYGRAGVAVWWKGFRLDTIWSEERALRVLSTQSRTRAD